MSEQDTSRRWIREKFVEVGRAIGLQIDPEQITFHQNPKDGETIVVYVDGDRRTLEVSDVTLDDLWNDSDEQQLIETQIRELLA